MKSGKDLFLFTSFLFLAASCGKNGQNVSNLKDDLYTGPSRKPLYRQVTDEFGPLYVTPGHFEAESKKSLAGNPPWSSWWYPYDQDTLYRDQDSTLEKYDRYMRKQGKDSHAAETERFNSPLFVQGDGLCNAWSVASITEPEPRHAARIDGIEFSVADLKALLLKSYEHVEGLRSWGEKFTGIGNEDPNDLYPDQFQRLVQVSLFDQGRAFVVDRDPTPAVWNEPIYYVSSNLKSDPSDAHVMHVDTFVQWAISDAVDPNFVGTAARPNQNFFQEYTYDFYGNLQADGRFKVEFGMWTGNSAELDHPDFAATFPDHPDHSSFNKEIDTGTVEDILKKASDPVNWVN